LIIESYLKKLCDILGWREIKCLLDTTIKKL